MICLDEKDFDQFSVKQKIKMIEEEIKLKRETDLHWNNVLVPTLIGVLFLVLLAFAAMYYEVKGMELVIIMIMAIYSFFVTSILLMTGRLGLQLAMLKIPFMRNRAGDVLISRYKKSGRASLSIEKYNSLISFDGKTSIAKVLPAFFSEETTGLPHHVAVEGFPFTLDPRQPYNDTILSQFGPMIGQGYVEHYNQGRQEAYQTLDKVLKYLKWILICLIIVIVVSGATLYFANNIGSFIDSNKETLKQGLGALETYLKSLPAPAPPANGGTLQPAG